MDFNNILILEGRVQDAKKKYPKIPEEVWEVFIQNDPSGNNKYLDFLGRQWKKESPSYGISDVNGNIRHAKDFINVLIQFHNVLGYIDNERFKNEIKQYGLERFKNVQPILDNPTDVYSYQSVLNDMSIVARIGQNIKEEKETEKRVKRDVEIIYEDNNILILTPKTWKASCIYGRSTKWCTAMKDSDAYFKDYTKDNHLIYLIDRDENLKFALLFSKTTNTFVSLWNSADKQIDITDLPYEYEKYLNVINEWLNENKKPELINNKLVQRLFEFLEDSEPSHYKLISPNSEEKVLISYYDSKFFAIVNWNLFYRDGKRYYRNWCLSELRKTNKPDPELIGETFNINPYDPRYFYLNDFISEIKKTIDEIDQSHDDSDYSNFVVTNGLYRKKPEGYDHQTLIELDQFDNEIETLIFSNEEQLNKVNEYESEIEFLKYNKQTFIDQYKNSDNNDSTSTERSVENLNREIEKYRNDIEQNQLQIEKNNLQIRQLRRIKNKIKTENKGSDYSDEQYDEIFEIFEKLRNDRSESTFILILYEKDIDTFLSYFDVAQVGDEMFEKNIENTNETTRLVIPVIFPGVEVVADHTGLYNDYLCEVKIKENLNEAKLRKEFKPLNISPEIDFNDSERMRVIHEFDPEYNELKKIFENNYLRNLYLKRMTERDITVVYNSFRDIFEINRHTRNDIYEARLKLPYKQIKEKPKDFLSKPISQYTEEETDLLVEAWINYLEYYYTNVASVDEIYDTHYDYYSYMYEDDYEYDFDPKQEQLEDIIEAILVADRDYKNQYELTDLIDLFNRENDTFFSPSSYLFEARLKLPYKDTEGLNYSFNNSQACHYYEHEEWCKYLMYSARMIEKEVNDFKLLDIRYFDQYQGPYAIVSFQGKQYKLWTIDNDNFYLEDFPINNMDAYQNPGYQSDLDEMIEMLNSYQRDEINEARLKKELKPIEHEYAIPLGEYLDVKPHSLTHTYQAYGSLEVFETVDGEEYAIGTDEEADRAFNEYMEQTIDELGISAFSKDFQQEIINDYLNKSFFSQMLEDHYVGYVEDIEGEDVSDERFQNRLEEEMNDAGIIDIDDEEYTGDYDDYRQDFIDYLVDSAGDPVEHYIDNYGDESMTQLIKENNILEVDEIIERVKDLDGRGNSLASYDGEENSIDFDGETYYIYRIN